MKTAERRILVVHLLDSVAGGKDSALLVVGEAPLPLEGLELLEALEGV